MGSLVVTLLVTVMLLHLSGGDDLYWKYNTNWDEPSNWALGRIPCGSDAVKLPENILALVNDDVTVSSIVLPENGVLLLEPSVTIHLSEDSECELPANTNPMAADVQQENTFISSTRWWECSQNWVTSENFPVTHPPCGSDNAIFGMGSTFSVSANESISVRSLTVRGTSITSSNDLDPKEFNLDISVKPECGKSAQLCPCPSDSGCPPPDTESPPPDTGSPPPDTGSLPPDTGSPPPVVFPPDKGGRKDGNLVAIVAGSVLIAILFALAFAVLTLIIILLCRYAHRRRTSCYMRDSMLVEPPGAEELTYEDGSTAKNEDLEDVHAFENPIYESTTLTPDEVQMIGSEMKPKLEFSLIGPGATLDAEYECADDQDLFTPPNGDDDDHVPKMNKYERL